MSFLDTPRQNFMTTNDTPVTTGDIDIPDDISDITEPTRRGFIAPEPSYNFTTTNDTPDISNVTAPTQSGIDAPEIINLSRTEEARLRQDNLFNRLNNVNERLNNILKNRNNISLNVEPARSARSARTYYSEESPFYGDTSQATPSYHDPSYHTHASTFYGDTSQATPSYRDPSYHTHASTFDDALTEEDPLFPRPYTFNKFEEASYSTNESLKSNFSQHDMEFYKQKTSQVKQAEEKKDKRPPVPPPPPSIQAKTDKEQPVLLPPPVKKENPEDVERKKETMDLLHKHVTPKKGDDEGGGGGGGGGGAVEKNIIFVVPPDTKPDTSKHAVELNKMKQYFKTKYGYKPKPKGRFDETVADLRLNLPPEVYAEEITKPTNLIKEKRGIPKRSIHIKASDFYSYMRQNQLIN